MRIFGKGDVEPLADQILERTDKFLEILGVEVRIVFHPFVGFFLLQQLLEGIDRSLGFGFETQHHVAVHLHEAPITIVGKARIAGLPNHALDRGVIESEIQHRVHHARHGHPRPGSDGQQQGPLGVAKTALDNPLNALETGPDLIG